MSHSPPDLPRQPSGTFELAAGQGAAEVDFDVGILGGGPAAAAASMRLASAGVRCLVVRRPNAPPQPRGEILPATAQGLLASLGLLPALADVGHARSSGMTTIWGSHLPYEDGHFFHAEGPAWRLDRPRLDAALAATVDRHATTVVGMPLDCRRGADGWQLEVRLPSGIGTFRARVLIDASGRAGWLARRQGARRIRFDRLVAVVATIGAAPARQETLPELVPTGLAATGLPATGPALVEAAPDGWWYCAPADRQGQIVIYFTDRDLLPRRASLLPPLWHDRLRQTLATRDRLADSVPGSLRLVDASSVWTHTCAGPGWLAVGDAALATDPLAAHGILHALLSGQAAADAVLAARRGEPDTGRGYVAGQRAAFARFLASRQHHYSREERFADRPFWKRRRQPAQMPV